MAEREQAAAEPATTAVAEPAAAAAPALAGEVSGAVAGAALLPASLLALQRAAGNRAATRHLATLRRSVLARDDLPQPDAGEEHRKAFDSFVEEMNATINGPDAARNAETLAAMRAKVDLELGSAGTATLALDRHRLVVDRRNLTAVMTRLRWRAMDLIHEKVVPAREKEQATADEEGRKAVRKQVLGDVRPYIDFLRGDIKDPESARNRFAHWYDKVQASTLWVLQAMTVESAESLGFKDGKAKARGEFKSEQSIERMGGNAWCGAFANYALRTAGLARDAAISYQFDHESGVVAFATYQDTVSKTKEVVIGDRKVAVRDYHAERNSLRSLQIVGNPPGDDRPLAFTAPGARYVSPADVDIQPGDILLLDNNKGARPDHIMIASGYHKASGRYTKIAGNEVDTPGRVNTGSGSIRDQPGQISAADHQRYERFGALGAKAQAGNITEDEKTELAKVKEAIKAFEGSNREFYDPARSATGKIGRIAAVARFSIVDFEQQSYVDKGRAGGAKLARSKRGARRLARAPSPEAETAEKMAPRLDDDTQAPAVINELNGQWIQIMLFVLKLLVEKHGKRDRLIKYAPAVPRVKAALDTVLNPEAAKGGGGLDVLVSDQKAQARGFARRREWLTAIPKKGEARPPELDNPLSELSGIIAAIHHERQAIEDTMAGNWQPPTLKVKDPKAKPLTAEEVEAMTPDEQRKKFVSNKLGGYMKTKASDPRDPTTYKARTSPKDDADGKIKARLEQINKIVWEELGHEGDVGSINTYDNAVLTWGKGWAGHGGRLPQLMKNLPQGIKDRLMDIGVAYTDDWYALAVGDRVVLKGRDALEYIRFRTSILSEMYALGQGDSAQGLVDAQADVMFKEFEQMPAEIRNLDDRIVMVVVHCAWWGGMSMGKAKALIDGVTQPVEKLRAIVRWQANLGSVRSGVQGGATIVTGWQANLLNKMGRGVIAEWFTERAGAPGKDAAGKDADHTGKALIKPDGFKQYIVV